MEETKYIIHLTRINSSGKNYNYYVRINGKTIGDEMPSMESGKKIETKCFQIDEVDAGDIREGSESPGKLQKICIDFWKGDDEEEE